MSEINGQRAEALPQFVQAIAEDVRLDRLEELQREAERAMPTTNPKPLTSPEKAFWKDAFLTCAQSTLPNNGTTPDLAADLCANFADAAMEVYRSRIVWWVGRKPG